MAISDRLQAGERRFTLCVILDDATWTHPVSGQPAVRPP
jgi:hypothetical protein